MTPIIDIVLLLIIFFMLVCQFIVAENFAVNVPDGCGFAQTEKMRGKEITTVTVMTGEEEGRAWYAVGAKKITGASGWELASGIAEAIDERLERLPAEHSLVCLRVDKDICFADTQYALAGIAQSAATSVQLAVFKRNQLVSD